MSKKTNEKCQIISQEKIAGDVFSMWLGTEKIALEAKPGQFVSVYSNDGSRLLPRPISICEVSEDKKSLRLVYRVAGKGTEEFSGLKAGDSLSVLGPLGNGFPLERARGKRVFLMGGGIGIPPMVEAAKELDGDKRIIVGYRDELFLQEELKKYGTVYTATEDGSAGTPGNVLDAIMENGLTEEAGQEADIIFACGPTPMLKAIKAFAQEMEIECWLSLEEKMACGIGACLACVCQSKEMDEHSQVHNKRVCKDGPVFLSTEVEL